MATILNPWVTKTNTYKGQLHTHTSESDGVDTAVNLVTAYKNAGFDFVSITDHNINTADPAVAGILFIPGVEESSSEGDILGLNVTTQVSGTLAGQYVINAINAAGGVAQINHPNWASGPWTDAEIQGVINFALMEIWNNKVAPNQNAENKYDACISNYNKRIWLTASDDCHNIATELGKGWIMVNSDTLSVSAIMAQIAAGNFYATTGAVISDVSVSGSTITVTTPASASIKWVKKNGTVIKTTTTATSDTYDLQEADGYARVVITRDSDGAQAWSQPVFIYTAYNGGVDDSYTKLLLHMDGSDNGVTFNDESGKAIGVMGNTCTKTATNKFGTASAYFDGTGDYLNCGDSADFRFGSGDFTIDFWIYPSTVANNTAVFGKHTYGAFDEYQCYFITGGFLKFEATTNGTSWNVTLTSGVAFSINTWAHIAIIRHGNVWAMYKDGVLVAAATVTGTIPTAYNSLLIGRVGAVYLTGYIDEFRVSKGVARWDCKFTPPTSEAVYDATYDKLLLLMNGDDNGTAFTDEAGKAVTRVGNACTKTAVKKFGSASVYFDGNGDYLELADSVDFEFGNGDFCVDFWMNPSSVAVNRGIFGKHTSGAYDEYYCYFSSAGVIRFYASTNGSSWDVALTANIAISTGSWYHIAVFREGNSFVLCVDGQPVAVAVSTGTIGTSASTFWVGRITTYYNNGYMDDFRVAKGDSRYSLAFTPPSAAYGPPAPAPGAGIFFATVI